MRIGIDLDGVLFDFVDAFRWKAKKVFKRDFPLYSSDWDFTNFGFTPEEYKQVWKSIRESDNWFLREEFPYDFAMQSLAKLQKARHELTFITNRAPTAGYSALIQAQHQLVGLGVTYPTVIVRSDKGPIIKALELDVYVDDYVENLYRAEACSPSTKLYLVNQTYNENLTVPESWTRVNSFKEFVEEYSK